MGVRDFVCIGLGRGVYMGVYYANLSFVEFRAMILGIPFLVHKLFTFYRNGVLNCKCPAPEPKG